MKKIKISKQKGAKNSKTSGQYNILRPTREVNRLLTKTRPISRIPYLYTRRSTPSSVT